MPKSFIKFYKVQNIALKSFSKTYTRIQGSTETRTNGPADPLPENSHIEVERAHLKMKPKKKYFGRRVISEILENRINN